MSETIEVSPCVRSGFCCKKVICGYGEANEHGGCKYLLSKIKGEGYEFFECGRHDYIIQQPGHEFMPAFGEGCCMAMFNSLRNANIKALVEERVPMADIIDQRYLKTNKHNDSYD